MDRPIGSGLSAKSMIDSSPQHHGIVLKLHIPLLYSILPLFLQRIVNAFSILSFMAPSWKQRYLVLCGSFLYKFNDETAEVPKGSPFDMETIAVKTIDGTLPELSTLPPNFSSVFSVSTFQKHHYYAVMDQEEALIWIRTLKEARQEIIKRNMGHSSGMPYPQSWAYFDSLGRSLVKSKQRIRQRMEDYNMREMEMSSFEAGSLARGYHG